MSSEAVWALDAAACNAAANDSDSAAPEVRTEHLLAVLALDPGGRARRVLNDLGVDIAAIKRELQCYITINPTRPARWWKRRALAQPPLLFLWPNEPDRRLSDQRPGRGHLQRLSRPGRRHPRKPPARPVNRRVFRTSGYDAMTRAETSTTRQCRSADLA